MGLCTPERIKAGKPQRTRTWKLSGFSWYAPNVRGQPRIALLKISEHQKTEATETCGNISQKRHFCISRVQTRDTTWSRKHENKKIKKKHVPHASNKRSRAHEIKTRKPTIQLELERMPSFCLKKTQSKISHVYYAWIWAPSKSNHELD